MANDFVKRGLAAVAAAVIVGLIGLFAVFAGHPWLFASLGPTAVMQAVMPELPASRPWNVAAGHVLALAMALFAVYVTGAVYVPAFTGSNPLLLIRVWAAMLALVLGLCLEFAFKASHPPSAATSLLISLGLISPDRGGIVSLACGILLVTLLGEGVRLLHIPER